MARYFIELSFTGTHYNGFASQSEGVVVTIQDEINKALSTVLKQEIKSITSSRTDAGVHALQNYLHFDYEQALPHNLIYKCNGILQHDLYIRNIFAVPDHAHSRFDALSRLYNYKLQIVKSPFNQAFSWYYPYKFNKDLLHKTAEIILHHNDFSAFSKKHSQAFTNNCTIIKSEWQFNRLNFDYTVQGDRFLRGMVRALVSTQLKVATNKMSIQQFEQLFTNQTIASADFGAPAHGLTLVQVNYPNGLLSRAVCDSEINKY